MPTAVVFAPSNTRLKPLLIKFKPPVIGLTSKPINLLAIPKPAMSGTAKVALEVISPSTSIRLLPKIVVLLSQFVAFSDNSPNLFKIPFTLKSKSSPKSLRIVSATTGFADRKPCVKDDHILSIFFLALTIPSAKDVKPKSSASFTDFCP